VAIRILRRYGMEDLLKISKWHFWFSLILWILGFLVFLFNLLGLWAAWHLAGFGYIAYMLVAHAVSLGAIMRSAAYTDEEVSKQFLVRNGLLAMASVVMTILVFFVFQRWFW